MPPKVTDTRPTPEALHAVEEKTAASARRIVATYSQDFMDGVTLMCMLGVEPKGLVYKKVADELEEAEPTTAKCSGVEKGRRIHVPHCACPVNPGWCRTRPPPRTAGGGH